MKARIAHMPLNPIPLTTKTRWMTLNPTNLHLMELKKCLVINREYMKCFKTMKNSDEGFVSTRKISLGTAIQTSAQNAPSTDQDRHRLQITPKKCRLRIYQEMWRKKDPKLMKALHAKGGPQRLRWMPDEWEGAPASTSSSTSSSESETEVEEPDAHAEEQSQLTAVIDVLQVLGLPAADATQAAMMMIREAKPRGPSVTELYGRGSLIDAAHHRYKTLEIRGMRAMDLRTFRPDGVPWDFSKKKDRQWARRLIREEKPDWIISSPPCTAFTILNYNCNYPSMDPQEARRRIEEGRCHLRFAMEICRYQLRMGKYFVHEHPLSAKSWVEPEVKAIAEDPRVHSTRCHQCMYGLEAKAQNGGSLPARKPTRWLTNSIHMAARLQKVCDRSHAHQPLESGRAAHAAFYPAQLVAELLRGIRDTYDADMIMHEATGTDVHPDDAHQKEEEKNCTQQTPPQNSGVGTKFLAAMHLAGTCTT